MGFKFRYEALLSLRERLKEQAEIELAGARKQLREARDRLDLYQGRYHQARDAFESRLKRPIPSGEICSYRDYLAGLSEKISAQGVEIGKREELVREKIRDLMAKTKQYRVMEKLKEKDLIKWRDQQFQEEQKWMNEVAITRHGRPFL
ncbi:MAG: flagellar export protein FliJ [Desulfatiglandales bacterium]